MRSILTPALIVSRFVLFLSFGFRASFGVFQIPIAAELNWFRSEFSFAIAIQNLAWGLGTPISLLLPDAGHAPSFSSRCGWRQCG